MLHETNNDILIHKILIIKFPIAKINVIGTM